MCPSDEKPLDDGSGDDSSSNSHLSQVSARTEVTR